METPERRFNFGPLDVFRFAWNLGFGRFGISRRLCAVRDSLGIWVQWDLGFAGTRPPRHEIMHPSIMSFWRRTAEFFGLKRNLVVLLVAMFVIGDGRRALDALRPEIPPGARRDRFSSSDFSTGCELCSAPFTLIRAVYWSTAGDIAAPFSPLMFSRSPATRSCFSSRIGARSSLACFCSFPGPAYRCPRLFRSSARRSARTATAMGVGMQIGHQATADHGRANSWRNPDRSFRHDRWRPHRSRSSRFSFPA